MSCAVIDTLDQDLEKYCQVEDRLRELTQWDHFLGWLRAQPKGTRLGRNGSYTDCLVARYIAQHFPDYHVWVDICFAHLWEKKPGEVLEGDWLQNPPTSVPVYFTLPSRISALVERLGEMDLYWLHARTCQRVAEEL